MAYNWEGDGYGYHDYPVQPPLRLRLRNYEGPYDPAALMRARDELLYHVQHSQNTAAWNRIRMKTPVNVNGIRDDDDGFGEPSDMYSHAELPENKELEEPYQGRRVDDDELTPPRSKDSAKQDTTATASIGEDKEEIEENENNNNDDGFASEKKIVSNEMDTSAVEIHVTVTSENADNVVEKNNDLIISEQIEAEHENTKLAEAMDGLEHHEIDIGDAEKDDKFESSNDEGHETDKKLVNKEATITIDTCITENKDSEEQKIENHNEDEVVTITIETNTNDNTISDIEVLGKNQAGTLEQESRPVLCSGSVLKCDHCEVRCSDRESMRKHLEGAVHYSASKFAVDSAGSLILKKKVVIINKKAKFKTTVMKCPVASCPSIFPQMDLCVDHYNGKHWKEGMPKSQYSLIDIVKEKDCCIAMTPPRCCQCCKTFKNETKLKKHLEEGHFPFTLTKYKRTFLCQYCERSFKLLDGLICHQEHHRNRNVIDDVFSFRVFQYENIRKFSISPSGKLVQLDGPDADPSGKREHDQALSDNETCMKVARPIDGSEAEVYRFNETVADEVDGEDDVNANVKDVRAVNDTDVMGNEINDDKLVLRADLSESDPGKVNGADTLQNTIKCDYCSEMNSSKEQMISHLNEMCHRSASPVLIDEDGIVQYMKDLSSILCASGVRQKAYVACSENCPTLFSTVKESIEHYILSHDYDTEVKPYYGLAQVTDEVILKVDLSSCLICGEIFESLKLLNKHHKENHYPFSLKDGCEIFFGCVYCPRFFYRFKHALSHVRIHSTFEENETFEVSVLYIDCSIERIELPSKHSRDADRREKEIKNIKYRINELEASSRTIIDKAAKKKMKKAIRAVKQSLVRILC